MNSYQDDIWTSRQAITAVCQHAEAVGARWGDPISVERQAELQHILADWERHGDYRVQRGPFDSGTYFLRGAGGSVIDLTGADVYWLAQKAGIGTFGAPDLHLEGAKLTRAHLEGANLMNAHLEGAYLGGAYLEGASLNDTFLVGANLGGAHLESADLVGTHLEGAKLNGAHLEGANLREAWLDSSTALFYPVLDAHTSLGDVHWNGVGAVNLSQIDWEKTPRIGEEDPRGDRVVRYSQGQSALADRESAVRAYRQVATQLRAQGMSEVADRFFYRSRVLQRRLLLDKRRFGRALGSWLLDLISGYGFKPARLVATYALVIVAFALAYFLLGVSPSGGRGATASFLAAIIFSVMSFHGRGFISIGDRALDDPVTVLATLEAGIGLLIVIIAVATVTRKIFSR